MYGVPEERFWHMNPRRIKPFRTAFEKKTNYIAWINGIYVGKAIGACFPKGTKYPEIPIESSSDEIKKMPDAEMFGIFALEINKKFKE